MSLISLSSSEYKKLVFLPFKKTAFFERLSFSFEGVLFLNRMLSDEGFENRRDFHPFGEEISIAERTAALGYQPDTVRQKFTGYERDNETDLDFAQARYYNPKHGRFTAVDLLVASARVTRPESWNRYVYCWNNPLKLVDPDGKDVQLLDEKAKERLLSTLPEELRKQVESKIDKKAFLRKGALDKIKSTDANFLDLRSAVNAKGTIEIMTASADPRNGEAFFYTSDAEERKEAYDNLIKAGVPPDEASKEADEIVSDPNRVRSMGLGVTLSPTDKGGSPNGNFRVVISDGTGDASDAPESDMAAVSAHEIYGHGLRAMQGKPWKHEYNQPPKQPGPVDTYIKQIEQRTRDMYKKP
jgi:RHS repeat-associated protein